MRSMDSFTASINMRFRRLSLILILLFLLLPILFNFFGGLKSFGFSGQSVLKIFPGIESRGACEGDRIRGPFRFLGEGVQCFVFESEDARYVIKLFKTKHQKPLRKWIMENPIFSSKSKLADSKTKWLAKFKQTCMRYQIAFDALSDETGLSLLHFAPTQNLYGKASFITRSGKKHILNLDEIPFILQEKGELVPKKITTLLHSGKRDEAVQTLLNLQKMLAARVRKGFSDARQCFSINYAFAGDKPLQIDVGRIVEDPQLLYSPQKEVVRVSANLVSWVKRHFPDLAPDLESQLNAITAR